MNSSTSHKEATEEGWGSGLAAAAAAAMVLAVAAKGVLAGWAGKGVR